MAGKVYRSSVAISRAQARRILDAAFTEARAREMEPLTAFVMDGGGNLIAAEREDGCAPLRFAVARGKAFAALGNGVASRTGRRAQRSPPGLPRRGGGASDGHFIPVPGGVLVLERRRRSSARWGSAARLRTRTSTWPSPVSKPLDSRPASFRPEAHPGRCRLHLRPATTDRLRPRRPHPSLPTGAATAARLSRAESAAPVQPFTASTNGQNFLRFLSGVSRKAELRSERDDE